MKDYRVAVIVPEKLYKDWREYLKKNHGIAGAGKDSSITAINSFYFKRAIMEKMEEGK